MVYTADMIRRLNPQGKMSMVSGRQVIRFEDGIELEFDNFKEKNRHWNKLLRMGYERVFNTSSDEIDGLVQAAELGENPFEFTMLCTNPKLNVSLKK